MAGGTPMRPLRLVTIRSNCTDTNGNTVSEHSLSSPASVTRVDMVMESVSRRIATRGLGAGHRLPSIRRLATALGVSRSTVVEAYERLVAEGLVTSRRGSGFYVARRPRPLTLAESGPRLDREIDPLWVMRQSLEAGGAALRPGCGWLPEDWMPTEAIRKALRHVARADGPALVEYGPPAGHGALRESIALQLDERGIEAGPARIVVTDGGTQAIDLLCRLLLRPDDAVLVDDPCHFNFPALVRAHRARPVGVPMTPDGPDPDAFARAAEAHRPRLYLTNGPLHNPTGASLAPARAHALLGIAERHDIAVIEDDIFADFEPRPGPRLAALDGLRRVAHVGSFSKTLSSAVRCGFVAAPADWVESLTDLKLATTFGNADLTARLVHRLLAGGGYRRHVEALRTRLAGAMARTARRLRGLGLTPWTEPRGGMFLWVRLPDDGNAAGIARRALAAGVVLAPGDVFSVTRSATPFLRFNVAQCGDPRIFDVLGAAIEGEPPAQKAAAYHAMPSAT